MSATQNPSVLLQNPLAAAAAAGLPGLSGLSFTPQEVQAMQQSFQQQAIQQLALLHQQGAAAAAAAATSQFSPQAQFYLQSHVSINKFPFYKFYSFIHSFESCSDCRCNKR